MDRGRRLGVLVLAWMLVGTVIGVKPGAAQDLRRVAAGTFALELDGAAVGFLKAVSGGEAEGDVVTDGVVGTSVKKHIGSVRTTDIVLEAGAGMEPAFYEWISQSWAGKPTRPSGAILLSDYNMQVMSRREFTGMIATTTLSALDAASKEPAELTVSIVPERVRTVKGAGTVPSSLAAKGQRPWLVSNFRLEIPGLDCSHVRKVDAITVKTKVVGEHGEVLPAAIEYSDVVLTLPVSSLDTWSDWIQTLVVSGNSDDSHEKNGDLILLGSDMQSEIARIHLFNLGIKSLRQEAAGVANQIRSATATLYCERMALEWKGGAAAVMNVRAFGR